MLSVESTPPLPPPVPWSPWGVLCTFRHTVRRCEQGVSWVGRDADGARLGHCPALPVSQGVGAPWT